MIHQPASSFYEAQTGEFILEAEELLKLRETITRVYVQRTGKPLWLVSEDMERDVFMSAREAQAYGIIDLVAGRSKPAHYVYDSACQLLNNLLETQDSQSEMSRNPPLFGDALSAEEHVLGCMCDSFKSWTGTKQGKNFSSIHHQY
ncbi:Clp protease proteolytic subunit /Translocation-enhancing protein TepA [Dillenia turbinata]|uniref:Clp protease proteolytic subunit /Translocation-enhancing protein TepA n=1 Tax=Dillenia turbinata TaxID=194707 RepID=A0AAN8VAI0_9MAGN